MTTTRYIEQHDAHLIAWLSAKLGLTIELQLYSREWLAYEGDYDYDVRTGLGNTAFQAAIDYAAGHNGLMFDALANIEAGEVLRWTR